MDARIARVLLVCAVLVLWVVVQPAVCEGWSLLQPFSSDASAETKAKKPVAKTVKKEPSALDKVGTGTKSFFNKTGETLGLKKPEAKKPTYASPRRPDIQRPKKPSKSWLDMFKAEEPKRPESVPEWMNNKRLDP
jgi:hypothetical protein